MLEDVREVGSFFQPFDEAASLATRAFVRDERRDRSRQFFGEAGDVGRRDLFEGAEADVACDDRGEAPVVGAAQGSNSGDFQLSGVVPASGVGLGGGQFCMRRGEVGKSHSRGGIGRGNALQKA